MGHIRSVCGIICILFLLWAEKIQCPAVNTRQPVSNFCVLRTQKGVNIRASLKPSLIARQNVYQMLVNNKRTPLLGVWDELWYSFYEFGKPSLTQSVDVLITHKTYSNSKEAFSVHLSSEKSASPATATEISARLVVSPHRSTGRGEDRIFEDVFLLIPEVSGNMKKESQTRRGPRDYLVLNQSLFEFPNSYCFNEKTRFLSLVDRQHRPCVEASSVDLEKQPYDFYIKAKVNEIRNEPAEFFLSSFGGLYDTATTSRHRSSVIFISQQPLILHIFIPNEKPSSRSTAAGVPNTVYFTITLHTRHLGSFLNDQCCLVIATIRDTYGIIYEYFDTLYSNHLGKFFTLVTAIIHDGCDVIAQSLQILTTFLKIQCSSAVDVIYSAAEELCDILRSSSDKLDSISFGKSRDYQWTLIWSYVDRACQKIGVLRADGDATVAAGWIAFSIFIDETIVDGTNTTIARQDTVSPASIGIPWTQSDLSLAMDIACTDEEDCMFVRFTVSDPCINYNFDTGRSISSRKAPSIERGGSDCDVIGVEGPPTGKLAPVLKQSREKPSDEGEGSDEACNIYMAQSSSVPQMSQKDDDFKQAMKDFLTDIDETYGAPSQPAIHLLREERSEEQDEGKMCMAQRDNAPKMPHEEKHLTESMKHYLADIDDTNGPPSQLRAIHLIKKEPSERHDEHRDLDEAQRIYLYPKSNAFKMAREDKDFQQSMRHFLSDIDETNGPPSQLRAIHLIKEESSEERDEHCRDLDEAQGIYLDPKSIASTMSGEYKDFQQSMNHFLPDIDETNGPLSRLRAIHLVKENPSGGQDEGTYADKAHKIYMAQKDCPPKVSLEENDFEQALKAFHADIDKTCGKNRTRLRRFSNFLWQCQDVTFYVLRIYLDNRFY
ncbi:hypothetical protein HOLleu_12138 [Holothuria leucospilota]|uniref:Generative cell specific-1/HAP2 domain-containing protein n=1 Tax=Holothuria leucospilota TaxID=206669 RepID=A0A9Q1C8Q5_HOLLE|nr:hypothetical protein HOLleu_12138 [Holothuria leucospilota]